jgi:nuclease S1
MKIAKILAVCLLAVPTQAMAWGRTGHAVIGDIAEVQLTPVALAQARQLLALDGAQHLSDVASWADHVRNTPGSPKHGVRLHFGGPVTPDNCHSHFCVIGGINYYESVLANTSQSAQQREVALKYVVHLVGDVHQPLHCVVEAYSRTPVIFEGKEQTLHQVWDAGIISEHGGDPAQIAHELLNSNLKVYTGGTPTDWAVESRDVAQKEIFADVVGASQTVYTLPPDYSKRHWPLAAQRLLQAGDRLAILLNKALH